MDSLSPSSPFLPADDEDEPGGGDFGGGGGDTSSASADADVRAGLVLQLLLDSVARGAAAGPALGHLLLGFDVADGPAGMVPPIWVSTVVFDFILLQGRRSANWWAFDVADGGFVFLCFLFDFLAPQVTLC